MMSSPTKLLLVVNDATFFLTHRLPLALAAQQAGYEVHVATIADEHVQHIRAQALVHHSVSLTRSGKNIFRELKGLVSLFLLFRNLKPDVLHLVTIKPVIYGGIAARICGIRGVVAAVSGLGSVFVQSGPWPRVLRFFIGVLYRLALGHSGTRVIFQNASDQAIIRKMAHLRAGKTVLIRGSGVDLKLYEYAPEPDGELVVTMASRLLRDKGVADFVEAARLLKTRGLSARFILAGKPDVGNPTACTPVEIETWRQAGDVELPGHCSDVHRLFSQSHIIVLPSCYGEGLPKVLIEAAACGRAVVTTDIPGCRDAIRPGETGLLVPPRDPEALAAAIFKLAKDSTLRQSMGRAARDWAEKEFDVQDVVTRHLDIYAELTKHAARKV